MVNSAIMIAFNLFPIWWVNQFPRIAAAEAAESFARYQITPRESEVIELICDGRTNQEIGDSLFISVATVKDHTHNIFRKTDVRNRVELANLFRQHRVR